MLLLFTLLAVVKVFCFLFPSVYKKQNAIFVTLTISLMQDQVQKLMIVGIYATNLGSAQPDKQVELVSLEPNSKYKLTFVTPKWIAKLPLCPNYFD